MNVSAPTSESPWGRQFWEVQFCRRDHAHVHHVWVFTYFLSPITNYYELGDFSISSSRRPSLPPSVIIWVLLTSRHSGLSASLFSVAFVVMRAMALATVQMWSSEDSCRESVLIFLPCVWGKVYLVFAAASMYYYIQRLIWILGINSGSASPFTHQAISHAPFLLHL